MAITDLNEARDILSDGIAWGRRTSARFREGMAWYEAHDPMHSLVEMSSMAAFLGASIEWLTATQVEVAARSHSVEEAYAYLEVNDVRQVRQDWHEGGKQWRELAKDLANNTTRVHVDFYQSAFAKLQQFLDTVKIKDQGEPLAAAYNLLGVAHDWSRDSVLTIVRGLRQAYHPDKHLMSNAAAQSALTKHLREINEAWDTIRASKGWPD